MESIVNQFLLFQFFRSTLSGETYQVLSQNFKRFTDNIEREEIKRKLKNKKRNQRKKNKLSLVKRQKKDCKNKLVWRKVVRPDSVYVPFSPLVVLYTVESLTLIPKVEFNLPLEYVPSININPIVELIKPVVPTGKSAITSKIDLSTPCKIMKFFNYDSEEDEQDENGSDSEDLLDEFEDLISNVDQMVVEERYNREYRVFLKKVSDNVGRKVSTVEKRVDQMVVVQDKMDRKYNNSYNDYLIRFSKRHRYKMKYLADINKKYKK